jgi:protein SCO1/2/putative membrane protein
MNGSPFRLVPVCVLLLCVPLAPSCGPDRGSSDQSRVDVAADSDKVLGQVGEIALTERSGRAVTTADLLGRPAVIGFFFTTCTTVCPPLTANMRRLQDDFAGTDVRLLSITVDPERDTTDVLTRYANSYTADPDNWWFLTGAEDEIYAWMRDGFHLAVDRLPDQDAVLGMQVAHATRLVVMDATGAIRGYYDGDSEDGRLRARERALFFDTSPRSSSLPLLNARLNACATLLLILGYIAIRLDKKGVHVALMLTASLVSAAFLTSYLTYHFIVIPELGPTPYNATGWRKTAYLVMLVTHIVLAVVNLPMVLRTLFLASRKRWEDHRRIARWTLPIWLYVSVTGVIVYLVLYCWNPPG